MGDTGGIDDYCAVVIQGFRIAEIEIRLNAITGAVDTQYSLFRNCSHTNILCCIMSICPIRNVSKTDSRIRSILNLYTQ